MKKILIVTVSLLALMAAPALAAPPNLESHSKGIWSIGGTKGEKRWIIIHNLAEGKHTGVYHIEVIQRPVGAPVWQILRLVKHMAITEEALKRSIVKPLQRGDVYPESFDGALVKWKAENGGKGGAVCSSSVLECLPK